MSIPIHRIDHLSERDKLWELYLHILAGFHGNTVDNGYSRETVNKKALDVAKSALEEWEKEMNK
jgi:hypothetical protein